VLEEHALNRAQRERNVNMGWGAEEEKALKRGLAEKWGGSVE
jgi:hypothetical protein